VLEGWRPYQAGQGWLWLSSCTKKSNLLGNFCQAETDSWRGHKHLFAVGQDLLLISHFLEFWQLR
jgi:hypothetical protein